MKHLNHRGSGFLLAVTVALAALMLLSALGIDGDWKPKTTPFRLVNEPFIGWSLTLVLIAGLVMIRIGDELAQCVSALVFAGLIFGLALVTGFFWDPWLTYPLSISAGPIVRSAAQTLKTMAPLNIASTSRERHAG